MTVEQIKHSGAYLITDIRQGQYCRKTYYGYTKKEAIALFRREFPARATQAKR